MTDTTTETQGIILTDAATAKVKSLLEQEGRTDLRLRVVVQPDDTTPTVTVNLWVGVGSRHEEPGRTGFAHLFEHLMFQGSAHVANGEHFQALMGVGGRLNATTWFDRTNYFETIPSGALELALWLEADRHANLLAAVNQVNLDNQRDVVKEEKRQRYDNQPYGSAFHRIQAALFPAGHPYHHPTIGSMEDLDAASVQDVHDFFARHYAPDNTVLTIVGDVSAERALELMVGRLLTRTAFRKAIETKNQPTCLLIKTVKGYGMGDAGEGQNITHQQKKMGEAVLKQFRDRFQIDLNDEHAAALRESFEEWTSKARRTAGRRSSGRRRAAGASSSGETQRIREWAREQGLEVSDRGRISAEVREAYEAAH